VNTPKPIEVGLIGCGWIMRSIYTPVLLSLPDLVRVTAVCDINEAAVQACTGSFVLATAYTDIETMLRKTKLDAVLVLTNEKATAPVTRQILQANLPIYQEKPPALNSPELEDLIAVEAQGSGFVHTAFNRRHTPLFSALASGTKLRRVLGALNRSGRAVASFPLTAVHVLDSAQHYAGSLFQSWKVSLEKKARHSVWTVDGKLENGVVCLLQFTPDGRNFEEFLVLETDAETWELQFPNTAAAIPEGQLIVTTSDGSLRTATRGPASFDSLEAMGFRNCVRDFIAQVQNRRASPLYSLSRCRSTIRLMNEMEALVK
jgi:virulence factor